VDEGQQALTLGGQAGRVFIRVAMPASHDFLLMLASFTDYPSRPLTCQTEAA
jgi:hypothetical protein